MTPKAPTRVAVIVANFAIVSSTSVPPWLLAVQTLATRMAVAASATIHYALLITHYSFPKRVPELSHRRTRPDGRC